MTYHESFNDDDFKESIDYQSTDNNVTNNRLDVIIYDVKSGSPFDKNIYLDISKKRNFKDLYDRITEAVNHMNFHDPYFYDRVEYAYPSIFDESIDIADVIYYILESSPAIEEYRNHIESVYNENIESNRCNPELQFTNEHAKIILLWSYLCLIAAPFIGERLKSMTANALVDKKKVDVFDSKFMINKVFVRILSLAEPNREVTNVLEKIRKMVSSRVLQTKYSDKMMWTCLYNLDIDPEITSENIRRQIIIEGVMKLNCPSNVVKYLHSLIKNQIHYLFRGNFDLDMHPVRSEAISGDTFSGTEHLETELSRRDEGNAIILDCILHSHMERMYDDYPFTEETFDIWSNNFTEFGLSQLQLSVLTRFLHTKVGNVECVKSMTFTQIIYSLIMIRSWMYDSGLSILPELISSAVYTPEEPKKITSRRKFLKDFITSSGFSNIINKHFPFTYIQVAKSKIIVEDISHIYSTNFWRIAEPGLITPNSWMNYDEYQWYEYDLAQLAQELLVFNEQIILADRFN